MLHFSFPCEWWPITPFGSLILGGKSWALGKQQMSVFSKCLCPSFPCTSVHSFHGPTPNLFVFGFFPQCLAVYVAKKTWRVFWGQIKRGNESREERKIGIKGEWKNEKDIFYHNDALKEQCRRVLNDCWWKTNGAERNSRGLTEKSKPQHSKQKDVDSAWWSKSPLHSSTSLTCSVSWTISSSSWSLSAVPSLSELLEQVQGERSRSLTREETEKWKQLNNTPPPSPASKILWLGLW